MRKRIIVLFALCAIAVFTISIFVWNTINSQQIESNFGELSIVRNFNTPQEERALTVAESVVDYATITGEKRFNIQGSEDYKNIGTYISYPYVNFIDQEVLNYYQERYNYQLKQTSPKGVTLNYMANVTQLAHVRITNDERTLIFYDADKSIPWTPTNFRWSSAADIHVFYKNQMEYQKLKSDDVDLTFFNCYVIEMKCQYHEYYAPLAAFWAESQQIVILDQNLTPILICIYNIPQVVT